MADAERDFEAIRIDDVREYWDNRPCNIRHSSKPVGTREYFDEVEARKYFVEPHIPRFAEFERWRDKSVLEVGCGIGTDTINFARAGARVTVIELSERSLELARQRAEVFGVSDRIHFHHGNAEHLTRTVPPGPYDLIYSFGVIHHTPHPDRVMREIAQVSAPGTTIKVMVYNRRSWKVGEIFLRYGRGRFWGLRELIAEHSEAQFGSPVTYTYTRKEGRGLVELGGFRVTDVFVDHIFPYRVEDYVDYRYVKEWYFRILPRPVFEALEHAAGWHLCVAGVMA